MNIILIILAVVNFALLVFLVWSSRRGSDTSLKLEFENFQKNQERLERLLREESAKNREESAANALRLREEIRESVHTFSGSILKQLASLTEMNERKLEMVRTVVEERLKSIQEDNSQKLEKMRETVDEKLQSTLEKRLGESFQLVSDRLEKVHQGLGEMQNLASGVGDLKKVLMNVKTRGTWGEVQLGNLLDQMLIPEQYERNVITKRGSRDAVEFAIKLPGRDNHFVYLPIDAKFPKEDYERLQHAQDEANLIGMEEAGKALEIRLKLEAKNIREKYIDPPNTTDFGVLFLPTEGLYAEVLRRPGLCDTLQRDHRIILAGPTTFAALLNSLQMGFRTLAVEKRASEVWSLLDTVKTEFGKFGVILEKTKEKLQQASNNIDEAAQKSRTIERKLRNVQDLPTIEHEKTALPLVKDTFKDETILQ